MNSVRVVDDRLAATRKQVGPSRRSWRRSRPRRRAAASAAARAARASKRRGRPRAALAHGVMDRIHATGAASLAHNVLPLLSADLYRFEATAPAATRADRAPARPRPLRHVAWRRLAEMRRRRGVPGRGAPGAPRGHGRARSSCSSGAQCASSTPSSTSGPSERGDVARRRDADVGALRRAAADRLRALATETDAALAGVVVTAACSSARLRIRPPRHAERRPRAARRRASGSRAAFDDGMARGGAVVRRRPGARAVAAPRRRAGLRAVGGACWTPGAPGARRVRRHVGAATVRVDLGARTTAATPLTAGTGAPRRLSLCPVTLHAIEQT